VLKAFGLSEEQLQKAQKSWAEIVVPAVPEKKKSK